MRFLRETLVAMLVLAAYGVVQAIVGARELEGVRPTTLQPNLPLTQLLGLLGFALSLAVYGLLARAVVLGGGTAGGAAARGALVGLLAGVVTDLAQAPVQSDYFRAVALAYGVPDSIATLVAAIALVVRPVVGTAIGAVLSWLAGLVQAPRRVNA